MKNELTPAHHVEIDRMAELLDVPPAEILDQINSILDYRVPPVTEIESRANDIAARHYLGNPIRLALQGMHRTTAYHWAIATKSKMADVMSWVDTNEWDAHELVKAFPLTLPRTEDGLIDPEGFDLADALNLALVTDQQAHIFDASAAGSGDDGWFDYIPDAISMLAALQAEDWAKTVAFMFNNPHVFASAYPDPDDVIADARRAFIDKVGFYIMDDASQLLLALMPETEEGNTDTSIHGPNPFA